MLDSDTEKAIQSVGFSHLSGGLEEQWDISMGDDYHEICHKEGK